MTQADFATLSLNGSGVSRVPRVRAGKRLDNYLDRFDSQTLWLDAIHSADKVLLICPRLNNLDRDVAGAVFRLDGQPVRASVNRYYRHTLIRLPAATPPQRVSVTLRGWTAETAVQTATPAAFAGRNTLMTLSKDNDLRWIEDWARFHVHHHGADAVLFVDNGSASYGPAQIEAALQRAGIEQITVLVTPLPYGPRGKAPFVNAELFLQTGVMNALKYRFLGQARAVLNCDVDELVMSPGRSIFDLTAESRMGYVSFPGRWVHPAPGDDLWPSHARHTHSDDPQKPCPSKWCLVPGGPLQRFQWRAHTLERLPLDRLFRAHDAWFYHCRNITNGWKSLNRTRVRGGTVPDPQLTEALRDAGLTARAA